MSIITQLNMEPCCSKSMNHHVPDVRQDDSLHPQWPWKSSDDGYFDFAAQKLFSRLLLYTSFVAVMLHDGCLRDTCGCQSNFSHRNIINVDYLERSVIVRVRGVAQKRPGTRGAFVISGRRPWDVYLDGGPRWGVSMLNWDYKNPVEAGHSISQQSTNCKDDQPHT